MMYLQKKILKKHIKEGIWIRLIKRGRNSVDILYTFLNEHTFRTVILGCTLLGSISGIIGCFAVLRKQSLLGDAVSHASLPGVCIAFLITGSKNIEILLVGALSAGVVCIAVIQIIQNYTRIKFDSALAFVLSIFFGIGLVLMSHLNKLPGANKSGLNRFIFGQASTFLERDIGIIFFIGIILLIIIILFWKEFKIVSFDIDFSMTLGYPAKIIGLIISCLIVITVIIGIQMAGVVLISAMVISPAVAARQWTDRLSFMIILAGIFGGISGFMGALISIDHSDIPTGPVIVIFISIIAIFSLMFSKKRGIIFKVILKRRRKKSLIEELKGHKIKLRNIERE